MKNRLLVLLVLLYMIIPAYAVEIEQRLYKDAASLGMGGVGVSTMGYQFSAIRNPAALGLMADHDIIPFLSLGASLNPEMIGLMGLIQPVADGSKGLADIDFDSLIGKAPSIGLNGPLNVGYMGKGFGFWTTTSTGGAIAVKENPNNFFVKNGLDVSVNTLAQVGSEVLAIQDKNNGNITEAEVRNLLDKYLGQELKQEGLTPEEIQQTVTYLATEIENNPDLLKDFLPEAKFNLTSEISINLAYGYKIPFAFIDNVSGLSLGATVRFAQRFKTDSGDFQAIDKLATSLGNITDQIYQAGSISSDFGVSLRLENFILGVAVRDAFSTDFVWKSFDGVSSQLADSTIPMSVDFGASYRFYFMNNWLQEIGLYVEFEDSTDKYSSWLNKTRLGSEIRLFNFLDLRVGMYDGFVTGGAGMGWKWFRMDFAYYREKYFDLFTSDQFYFNMTVGLDNSPQRKQRSLQKQLQQDRIQAQSLEILNDSLKGLDPVI